MKKAIFLSVFTIFGGSFFLFNDEAKAHDENEPQKISAAEYDYDSGEYSFTYIDGVDIPEEEDGMMGIMTHDPKAGGGKWKHWFNGIKDHHSVYDHYTWPHRASVKNARTTINGPWRQKNGGESASKIAQTATNNKAHWRISVDGSLTE